MKPVRTILLGAAALCALAVCAPIASASPQPAWTVSVAPVPSNLAPGSSGRIVAKAINVGGTAASGTTEIEVALPGAVTALTARMGGVAPASTTCSASGQLLSCKTSEAVAASGVVYLEGEVEVSPSAPAQGTVQATVSGGGSVDASATQSVSLGTEAVPFGYLTDPVAPFSEEDGAAALLAGSHPYQQTVTFELPTSNSGGLIIGSGHLRDALVELPAGLIGDPAATPVLCTEAHLEETLSCPDDSAVGVISTTLILGQIGFTADALYNMVPPPGYPAMLAANIAGQGLFVHLLPSVRSDGDYGISIEAPETLAFPGQPVFGIASQVWGDPSSPLHEHDRGNCAGQPGLCPVADRPTAFWTLPSRCDGRPLTTTVGVDSWEEPGLLHSHEYASSDLGGSPVSLSDCGALSFNPTIEAKPTTNLADSPSGLDFDLHQPQSADKKTRANPPLRDATVTLPQGMAVNPSQADGLGACTEAQIGFAEGAEAGIHFDKNPSACPDAAKLGTVEVSTPLIVRRDAEHRLELDPETKRPLQRPLKGSVYLAKPFENPFGSLLAIYLAVEDPETGTVAKLAGEVRSDPQSGQLTTVFEENPQLPIEDIELHLFGGARGSLITPPTCGSHTAASVLEPWSAPDTPEATPSSSFQTTAAPGGGPCPQSEAAMPNSPAFSAGTLNPQAGAYSPFVLKLAREDGSQRLTAIDTLLPPGLTGKLAGIPECTEAQIAQAASRIQPEEGRLERESPSCPAATEVGSVVVGAGAGPTPFYTTGHAYLAGPYKGAPLSLAVIVPAVAGPFDLGTVVTRVALQVEPESARIHAVSDPLPTILEGIPLDVRSVALRMDRPGFILNPTSCDPMAIAATATSSLGQAAALSTPFQVGGCSALAFKPKLSLRLKGAVKRSSHPKLIAKLKARPGEANIARAQVKLPRPVFLDQSHIRTICTRVQFAADACPPGSIYGKAGATTPLLDQPLSGSVYLRSNPAHELPDLVAKLKGPASQPIEIDLVGKTDAVKAALRNTFEAVPDAPVSSFRLELFGGKRGLVEMSDGFCRNPRATVKLDGQNGKVYDTRPVVGAKCPRGSHGRGRHPKRGR